MRWRSCRPRSGPEGTNPRSALAALGIPILRTSFWRWPFGHGTDYLACATVAAVADRAPPAPLTCIHNVTFPV